MCIVTGREYLNILYLLLRAMHSLLHSYVVKNGVGDIVIQVLLALGRSGKARFSLMFYNSSATNRIALTMHLNFQNLLLLFIM